MFFGFALLYIPFHLKFKGVISRQALKHKITKTFINASMLLSMMTVSLHQYFVGDHKIFDNDHDENDNVDIEGEEWFF